MRRTLTLGIVALVATSSLAAVWTQVWGPEARARLVADVLAGRAFESELAGMPETVLHYVSAARDAIGLDEPVRDSRWASTQMIELSRRHPAALAHAARGEKSPDVRYAFLDVIEDKPAYVTEVSPALKLEHVTSHVMMRLDLPTGKPLNDAEKSALGQGRDEALPSLRALLVRGHCGALAGYEAIGARPAANDVLAATAAVATAAADPEAELSPSAQDHCRDRFAAIAAPTTDGSFRVKVPGL